jgi:hypothetical protein
MIRTGGRSTPAATRRSARAIHLSALAAAAITFGAVTGWPARAEDSGFWDVIRSMSRGYDNFAPSPDWGERRAARRAARQARRTAPTKTQVVRLPEQPAPVLKAADPLQRPNPLATLLRDPTLRKGDIVMFPDGPRVFTGDHGTRHAMADFVSASRSKTMAKSTRKILASLPVGENNAWSADTAGATGRLAHSAPDTAADVEATGAVTGKSRSRR